MQRKQIFSLTHNIKALDFKIWLLGNANTYIKIDDMNEMMRW